VCGRCKKPLHTAGAPQDVDAAGVARAIAPSPVPLLVDFWAPWCGPVPVAAPIFDQVARQLAGERVVLKVDTEATRTPRRRHQIRAIPTAVPLPRGRGSGWGQRPRSVVDPRRRRLTAWPRTA
jgi:thioredoxin 2